MTQNSKPSDEFNYFSVCETCTDSECCAEPYFTFCARNEIDKIKDYIKEFPPKLQNFLDIDTITYNNKRYKYYGFNKIDTKCIFLEGKRKCLIHEVKPLHCRCWPLVWSWEEEGNKLFIYIDENHGCSLTEILSKNSEWIKLMKEIIISEVQKMPKVDRFAFASLDTDDTIRMIEIIDLQK